MPTPEFDIEIRYWTTEDGLNRGRFKVGWRYVIQWVIPERQDSGGQQRVESLYGFVNHHKAKQAAEYRATQIAQGYKPVEKYKFTPEV